MEGNGGVTFGAGGGAPLRDGSPRAHAPPPPGQAPVSPLPSTSQVVVSEPPPREFQAATEATAPVSAPPAPVPVPAAHAAAAAPAPAAAAPMAPRRHRDGRGPTAAANCNNPRLVPWTDSDEQRLWELVRAKGRAWTLIAAAMTPFTDNQIKKCMHICAARS